MATPAWELIDSNTLTSSASSVTFSSIPQDYRDLILVIAGGASGATFTGTINGDTGSNYSYVRMYGDGSTAVSNSSSSRNVLDFEAGSVAGQNTWILNFMDYSATDKHKTILTRFNQDLVGAYANRYASTSAITSISINNSVTIDAGSTFYLWGLNTL